MNTEQEKRYIVFTTAPGANSFPLAVYKTLEKAMYFTGGDCYLEIKEAIWDGEGRIPLPNDCKKVG